MSREDWFHIRKLLLATRNRGKLSEYRALLAGVPFTFTSLEDEGILEEVSEEGCSFEENASLKARRYAQLSGLLALADDSGLEVDALGGEPGTRSARYAGKNASDRQRIQRLLSAMARVPLEKRTARFRCVIALAWPSGRVELVEGTREGLIAMEPRGGGGFGYDPVFCLPELGRTMAELSHEEKNRVSHRAEAAHKAVGLLRRIVQERES